MKNRCGWIDTLRGFTVVHMVIFHACWDLVYLFGMQWNWYHGQGAYIWQQFICCTFIMLSGFCAGMSRHLLKRGWTVFGCGAGVTLVTLLVMPEDKILFGVLTLIGSCMLMMAGVRQYAEKLPAWLGASGSFLLFGCTRHVSSGYLGLWTYEISELPEGLYRNYLTAYLGFPQRGFSSSDYFPLLPWVFLFLTGFYIYRLWGEKLLHISWKGIVGLRFIGRHALEIYVLHQPVLYGLLYLLFMIPEAIGERG